MKLCLPQSSLKRGLIRAVLRRAHQLGLTGLLFVGLAAFTAFLSGCERTSGEAVLKEPPPPLRRLTVVTPHSDDICRAFALNFSAWHSQKHGGAVIIDWVRRGTPECLEYVRMVGSQPREGRSEQADVMFGGGISDHDQLVEEGLSRKLALGAALKPIPAEAAGLPTSHPDGYWFATGLSSFGIFYNARDAAARGIAPPKSWSDLADPRFAGWLGIANPNQSGSHLQTLLIILQHHGWEEGWALILRLLGNTRGLVGGSGVALDQTVNGVFLSTFVVNFDGLSRESRLQGRVKFLNPPGATALTPDVVSALTTASGPEQEALASAFVEYCLSDDAQKLWGCKPPADSLYPPLYHYPINPAIYEKFADQLAVSENPFRADFGVKYDREKAGRLARIVPALIDAICEEHHIALQQTLAAAVATRAAGPGRAQQAAALKELLRPPLDEKTALELGMSIKELGPEQRAAQTKAWAESFKAALDRARGLLQSQAAPQVEG